MAWANGFVWDGFSVLLCEWSPAFRSANVHWFCSWDWGWKRLLRCQPRHSLCLGERELPARLSASCQLKELMTQIQAKHSAEAKREGGNLSSDDGSSAKLHHWSSQLRNTSHKRAMWFCVHGLVWKHTYMHVHTHTHNTFLFSHSQFLPELEYWDYHPPVEKAILGSWNDYYASLRFCDSRKVITRYYDSAGVSSCLFVPCVTLVSIPHRGKCWGKTTDTSWE